MSSTPYKVLFLCTGNSARSIMAEHILRARGAGRFETFSAGSHPAGRVNPFALEILQQHQIATDGARSKSWDEYRGVKFDFVITVCDHAKESCPVWPGQPVIAHWGSPDPAAVEGTDEIKRRMFLNVFSQIASRISIFCAFRDDQLDEWNVRTVGTQFPFETSSRT
ncbi:MAG: arsenate reductase ArsC [Opitutaceae bacterium]|nr:arsenate reductase ArsC [Opitutaceae bacterium]